MKTKLTALKAVGEAAKKREFEFSAREETLLVLKNAIGRWEKFAATTEEKYSHIEAAERKKITDACTAADQLLATDLQKQSKMSKTEDPLITVAGLNARVDNLNKLCTPIMNKPKPKPEPKPEEKKPEAAAASEKPASTGAAPEAEPAKEEGTEEPAKEPAKPQPEADMDMD